MLNVRSFQPKIASCIKNNIWNKFHFSLAALSGPLAMRKVIFLRIMEKLYIKNIQFFCPTRNLKVGLKIFSDPIRNLFPNFMPQQIQISHVQFSPDHWPLAPPPSPAGSALCVARVCRNGGHSRANQSIATRPAALLPHGRPTLHQYHIVTAQNCYMGGGG